MRKLLLPALFVMLAISTFEASAAMNQPAGLSRADTARIEYVQDKKSEPLKQKVKRIWRNLTGYKFDVACPFQRSTCTDTGKNRGEARAKCIARNPLCLVTDR